jgi:L-iditol 2-dehydrogenase
MLALVKNSLQDGDVRVQELPEPAPAGAGEVVLEVKAAGVCGSDVHLWRNHHSWRVKLPLVLGHEFCGVVADVGPGVDGFQPGDRVVCETAASVCGKCAYCVTGHYNLCPHRQGYGALADGAFRRYVAARPQILHHFPESLPFEYAALTEPICVAYNALVEKVRVRPGDTVVVQGVGPIGIFAIVVARLQGASTIIALGTGTDGQRLRVASAMGADYALSIEQDHPVELVGSLGDGYGADLVVDCTGVSAALKQSLEMVRPNGTIAKIGWGPQPVDFSLDPLVGKAITLQGTFSHTYGTWERVIALLACGQIDLEPVIGGLYGLADWREGFSRMEQGINVKSVLMLS